MGLIDAGNVKRVVDLFVKPYLNPVVALNLALRFIKPLAIKGRLLNQCHLLD